MEIFLDDETAWQCTSALMEVNVKLAHCGLLAMWFHGKDKYNGCLLIVNILL